MIWTIWMIWEAGVSTGSGSERVGVDHLGGLRPNSRVSTDPVANGDRH